MVLISGSDNPDEIMKYVQQQLFSLVPRPSITANAVEGLPTWNDVGMDVWRQFAGSTTPPNVHLTSFHVGVLLGLPTALAVTEGLGTKLH